MMAKNAGVETTTLLWRGQNMVWLERAVVGIELARISCTHAPIPSARQKTVPTEHFDRLENLIHAFRSGISGGVGGEASWKNVELMALQEAEAALGTVRGGYALEWEDTHEDGTSDGVFDGVTRPDQRQYENRKP